MAAHIFCHPKSADCATRRPRTRLAIQTAKVISAAPALSHLSSRQSGMGVIHAAVRRAVRLHHISHPKSAPSFVGGAFQGRTAGLQPAEIQNVSEMVQQI
jgi:hypothetical protein